MARFVGLALVGMVAAACGGASPTPTGPVPSVAAAAPAASTAAAGGISTLAEGMTLTIDGATTEYSVTCTIAEGTSVLVEGRHGGDTAAFHWDPGTMPWVDGVTGGAAWKSGDLNASITFDSAHSWRFSGELPSDDASRTLEGKATCN